MTPDPNAEYVYRHALMWRASDHHCITVIPDSHIVTNVKEIENGYTFCVKGQPNERYWCHYAWAFAPNTPENRAKIKEYNDFQEHRKATEQKNKQLYLQIETLEDPATKLKVLGQHREK
jgi:hypothetical protein